MGGITIFFTVLFTVENALAGFENPPIAVPPVPPVDTIYGVAIYACSESLFLACAEGVVPPPQWITTYDVPMWYANIWDTTPGANALPNYFKDLSFGKHVVYSEPRGQNNNTQCFVSSTIVKAVGDSAKILHTTDKGLTWTIQTSGTTKNLHGVSFADVYIGIAVGDSGTILRTTDGGETWTLQTSPTTNHLFGVSFNQGISAIDTLTVIAVGASGTILRSTDSGQNWEIRSSPTTNDLNAVYFTDYSFIIAVGANGTILESFNGQTWILQPSPTSKNLYDISIAVSFDLNIPIIIEKRTAVGDSGTILRSQNGGAWTIQTSPTQNTLYGVSLIDSLTGIAVGASGTILQTTNGGTNWTIQTSPTSNHLYGVSFPDPKRAVAVGASGTILITRDSGGTWTSLTSGVTNHLKGVSFKLTIPWEKDGGLLFYKDILKKADAEIDFSQYDKDNDCVVDFLFLINVNHNAWCGVNRLPTAYFTNDSCSSGGKIRVVRGIPLLPDNRDRSMFLVTHEYGHHLGLGDYYNFRIPVSGYGLGRFEVMGFPGFQGRPSPYNPWFRSNHVPLHSGRPLNWLKPTVVTSSLPNQPIQEISTSSTGKIYLLDADQSGEKFLVSSHRKLSQWEQFWPDRGLMIWHVDDSLGSYFQSLHKVVDLEAPHGLWDWDFNTNTPSTPNPISGLDSLDVSAVANLGSATCIFRDGINTTFDAFTNPSSDEYNDAPYPQNIASHIAVRNIHLDLGDTTVMRADLIVNRVESNVATATGENNGRRWILGQDGKTMHLVYVSKGYIYYTTTDSNKIWLPAIPIGQGSFPSLSLDTSGNPSVVWVQQGMCGLSNSKLYFSRKSGTIWTTPFELLSISDGLRPPSFVIDTLNMGHVVYKVHFCQVNGNCVIHYGTFNINAPTPLTPVALDASNVSCGNATIDYTQYLSSVHVAWEKERKIFYNWKDASGWHTPEDVSQVANDLSKTPYIDVVDDTVNVVWGFESTPGHEVILYRKKQVSGISWEPISSPSGTNVKIAQNPIVLMVNNPISRGLYALWSGIPTGGTVSDIFYSEWDGLKWQSPLNVSNTPGRSNYPQAFQRIEIFQGDSIPTASPCLPPCEVRIFLDVVWTDGDNLPFHVANQSVRVTLPPSAVGGPQSGQSGNHLPKVFALSTPFPSPFRESILLRYQLPRPEKTTLKIYDLAGRLVKTSIDEIKEAGYYSVKWNGEDNLGTKVTSGVYFARFEAEDFQKTRKIIFLK